MLTGSLEAARYDLSPIDRVWSGHSVGFALAETDETIFVAYYDALRRLTVASRPRDDGGWTRRTIDVRTDWDSHKSIAMAVDGAGHVHVAANMHNEPLVYFRSARPGDVSEMVRVGKMVSRAEEQRITYPAFLADNRGRLVFSCRDGVSGDGRIVLNLYDEESGRWRHLLPAPLVEGEGVRSAYVVGPRRGPDGWFHAAWVWRDSPDAATCHDLSYARSRDLVEWVRSDGTPFDLPITLSTADIVDPVPVRSGLINNNTPVGFDPAGNPVVAFHKYDADGNTQVYAARRVGDGWAVVRASDWQDFRWDFGGFGSLAFRLTVDAPFPDGPERICVPVVKDGVPTELVLDAETLERMEERPRRPRPEDVLRREIDVPVGMQLNVVKAIGRATGEPSAALAWAACPPNRDRPGVSSSEPTTLYLALPRGTI